MKQVKSRLAEPDELAPAHPRVDREIDECAEPLTMRFRKLDGLFPREENHLSTWDVWRLHPIERVGENLLLLHGDLEHAPEGPVVAVDRARRDPGFDLVHQP